MSDYSDLENAVVKLGQSMHAVADIAAKCWNDYVVQREDIIRDELLKYFGDNWSHYMHRVRMTEFRGDHIEWFIDGKCFLVMTHPETVMDDESVHIESRYSIINIEVIV